MPTKTERNLASLAAIIETLEPGLTTKSINAAIVSATEPAMLGKLVRSITSNPQVLLDAAAPAMRHTAASSKSS